MTTIRRPLVPEDRNGYAREVALGAFVRACIATSLAALDKTTTAPAVARKRWEEDRGGLVEMILRAAVSPTTIASAPAIAHVGMSLLAALVPQSAGADLLVRAIALDFAGQAQISVPGISLPNADFVAEGAPIAATIALTNAGATLTPHKLAAIVSLTGEMVRNSAAEPLVRQVLIESAGPAVDKQMFSANAAGAGPAGLLFGIAALTPAASGEKAQIIIDDLQTLATAIAPVAGNGQIILIASPDVAVALKLRLYGTDMWPTLTSATLAPKTLIALAANAIVSAVEGAPVIEATQEAEYVRDSVPQEIVNSGGVVGTSIGSLFQSDAVGLRLRWPLSWALRSSNALAWMTGVNW
jgi:hypothetical protein